ncbi:MAG: site-2 protease family protein [Patescibacteria group bacterium]
MFLQLIANSPTVALVWIIVILLSLTVHEFFHALVANWKGDKTAELAGRLTLNPIPHIDPIGLIPLLLLGFGWAKPVPFNPYNLKDPKRDAVHIALAGPLSNLLMAVLAGVTLRILLTTGVIGLLNLLTVFLVLLVIINLFLMFFNIIPIHPLDGSKLVDALLHAPQHQNLRNAIARYGSTGLMVLVMLSIMGVPVFSFISWPSFFVCDALVGQNCSLLLMQIFS